MMPCPSLEKKRGGVQTPFRKYSSVVHCKTGELDKLRLMWPRARRRGRRRKCMNVQLRHGSDELQRRHHHPLSLQSPRDTLERTFDSGIAKLKDLPAKAIETA